MRNLVFNKIGDTEVKVSYRDMTGSVRCVVTAGPPCQVQVLDWPTDQAVNVYSDRSLPTPLKVQLLDAEDNPAKVKDVKVSLFKEAKLKVKV